MPTAGFIRVQVQFFRQKAAAPTAVDVDAMGKAEPGTTPAHRGQITFMARASGAGAGLSCAAAVLGARLAA
jgi:hypothetical protein